jgi:hypothetical protein
MDVEQRARELLASHLRGKGWTGEFAAEVLQDRPADVRISGADAIEALVAALTPPEGYAEQHARDSRELRSLCAARDEARRERDIAKNESSRMKAALKKIAGYRLDQFAGPYDMASACTYDAENALPGSAEVPDGRG